MPGISDTVVAAISRRLAGLRFPTLFLLLVNVLDFGAGTIVVREASRDRAAAGRLIGVLIGIKARFALLGVAIVVALALLFEGLGPRFGLIALAALHLLCHAPAAVVTIFAVDMAFRWSVAASVLGQTAWALATAGLVAAGVLDPEGATAMVSPSAVLETDIRGVVATRVTAPPGVISVTPSSAPRN